ncbi:NUMOD4 motif-containing HNH endonuclease [Amycolatopsis sp. 195334CR]|uniref:NUMOD4 motif-containing HNH endonuclease n=1 Tax=Amycolatopsis sp. 195334CR TaxID=2814588 RepID=UPI001A8DE0F6|nr:NUMOD4 motif-containing HNH endonuclease [Amycolatopsis sp. 195334CR]MBN6037453.1 NUMOD4 motif-containing HNH endonuclease [Amycolatopsis sp. 195334CR]
MNSINGRVLPETWRSVPGFEGRYSVSDWGRVLSHLPRHKNGSGLLRPSRDRKGYLRVGLFKDGRNHTVTVHKLVLTAFVGPRPEGLEARHLDGNPAHNALVNLCWGSSKENAQDTVRLGRHASSRRTACPSGHRYAEEGYVDRGRKRRCRSCEATRRRARTEAERAQREGARRG